MKGLMVFAVLLATAVLLSAAAETAPATYADHDKVAKGGSLVTAPEYTVSVLSRNMAGQVEVHEKETDIFYVMDGEATFVTGGTMVDGKPIAADEIRGREITGGETRQLVFGDVMIIPNGVPHWFKEVKAPFLYYVVKVR